MFCNWIVLAYFLEMLPKALWVYWEGRLDCSPKFQISADPFDRDLDFFLVVSIFM